MENKEINNKIILLRKSLKSILNQTKLNLAKKIKRENEKNSKKKNTKRKESELECFKRIKSCDVPLSLGLYPDKLIKIITNAHSIEIDRVIARILQNSLIQKTLVSLKEKYGVEVVERFLKNNEKKIKKTELKRLTTTTVTTKKKRKVSEELIEIRSEESISDNDDDTEVVVKENKPKSNESVKKQKKKEKSDVKEQQVHQVEKTIDPFFVSETGESYLATITAVGSDDENEIIDKKERSHKKSIKKSQPASSSQFQRKDIKKVVDKITAHNETTKEQDLHPSWKAKQQMKKFQIQEFKGSKIKFDDD
ncbi:hypothetical protein PVAND_002921 [Polypedilum vanderplanki]|uniref:Serum response factor-binding protein 1 n=1 Tax=Polypedilum vanderplanki TaxID=319348 RepID=A0A9J6BSL5_POLVA|nr:hypothetical protein PVAND_002921 [Polypedilum vanderplanki]